MNDPCSILCTYYVINEGYPAVCVNPDAVSDAGHRVAGTPNCKYFQLRDGHHKMIARLCDRIDGFRKEIDAERVEADRMWCRRFITAGCIGAMLLVTLFAIINIWVMP